MRIRVEVKLPGAEPLVQEFAVSDRKVRMGWWAPGLRTEQAMRMVAAKRVERIQKRYPTAEVSWREVEQ